MYELSHVSGKKKNSETINVKHLFESTRHVTLDINSNCLQFLCLILAHLKAVESAIVFEGEDMVWDGEKVPLSCDKTPNVHGLRCKKEQSRSQRGPQHATQHLSCIFYADEINA